MVKPLLIALQFLTRLPVPSSPEMPDEKTQGYSVLYYPVVGLIIGLLLCLVHFFLSSSSTLLQAALILVVWVGVTGALHIDGLADIADAWIGGQGDRDRTMEIMKDPNSGPIAVAAVVLLLLIKFAAIESLITDSAWQALLLAPMIGRGGLVAALQHIPYVRPQGLGSVQASNLPNDLATSILLAGALFCFLLLGWNALIVLTAGAATYAFLRQSYIKRIGGITGDAAGALCELVETAVLVSLALVT